MRKGDGVGTDITARSISTYIATQEACHDSQIKTTSEEELTAKKNQLLENLRLTQKNKKIEEVIQLPMKQNLHN